MRILSTITLIFSLLFLSCTRIVLADTEQHELERFRTYYTYALLADAAYKSQDRLRDSLADSGFEVTAYDTLSGYGVSYFLLTNTDLKRHIIVVRGTSNIENVMVDVAFKLVDDAHTGIKLHQGFAASTRYLYERIRPKLNRDYQIDTTGHSLGGAVAIILAMTLDAADYSVGKVITFGQPKVSNMAGSKKYAHLDVTRVVTLRDVVPLSPPLDPLELMKLDIYWHQGTEVVLLQDDSYAELEGISSMMRATDFFNDIPSEQHLTHHYISTYIDALRPKLHGARKVEYKNDFSISDWFQ